MNRCKKFSRNSWRIPGRILQGNLEIISCRITGGIPGGSFQEIPGGIFKETSRIIPGRTSRGLLGEISASHACDRIRAQVT